MDKAHLHVVDLDGFWVFQPAHGPAADVYFSDGWSKKKRRGWGTEQNKGIVMFVHCRHADGQSLLGRNGDSDCRF
jgi:hypothetical protein